MVRGVGIGGEKGMKMECSGDVERGTEEGMLVRKRDSENLGEERSSA